jgi:AcrR family transcriptional regulator
MRRDRDGRKAALLDDLADFVLDRGLDAASLRPLARAAGTSDRMLIYHFGDKDSLIAAVIAHVAARLTDVLQANAAPAPLPADRLQPLLLDMTLRDDIWPFLRLWLQIAARAGQGDPFFRAVGGQIGRGFIDWIAAQIDADSDAARQSQAARLFVLVEGLILVRSLGLDGICRPALD